MTPEQLSKANALKKAADQLTIETGHISDMILTVGTNVRISINGRFVLLSGDNFKIIKNSLQKIIEINELKIRELTTELKAI